MINNIKHSVRTNLINLVRKVSPTFCPNYTQPVEQSILAFAATRLTPKSVIVEIGCNEGKTTQIIAESNTDKTVIGIDYDGGASIKQQQYECLKDYRIGWRAKYLENVMIINAPSSDLGYELSRRCYNSIDMVFIDGDHSYNGVKNDTVMCMSLVRTGGLIFWHDYTDDAPKWVGVKRFLDELDIDITHIKGTNLAYWIKA